MERLTLVSTILFLIADIFAIISIYKPYWILSVKHVVLLCCSAVIYPMGFDSELIGGAPFQLPSDYRIGYCYIFFILSAWLTVLSELIAGKMCFPRFT
ncbi:unnamed protein product [Didymodactylos carnosus]|uniref:Uncharacterized protein n=1 Tax=Didymodactylos carnosus TaxID=1234261 RepID=A0A814FJ16_9BILA|nr:unnamed protein product [Didymodactylos carnosus]CAF1443921.1 unnamed protein product [Didymodactylos carnosus]CAF3755065.1 unnamed protein product [Didymodactylos carnosus]CAF4239794.1 unnamed protein product [Didymodactylos carnosus]